MIPINTYQYLRQASQKKYKIIFCSLLLMSMCACSSFKFSKQTNKTDPLLQPTPQYDPLSTNDRQPAGIVVLPLIGAVSSRTLLAEAIIVTLGGMGIAELASEYAEGSELNIIRQKICVHDLYYQQNNPDTTRPFLQGVEEKTRIEIEQNLDQCPDPIELQKFCQELVENTEDEEDININKTTIDICKKINFNNII